MKVGSLFSGIGGLDLGLKRAGMRAPVFRPALNSHLYCWVTNNHLPSGLWLVDALGFRYITLLTWAKDRFGLGQYFRGQTEHLIFAVRGRLPAKVKTCTTLLNSKRGRHSAKPEAAYQAIEDVSPGPYLEMFARTHRPGWDAWGNEVHQVNQQQKEPEPRQL
jgi:N6-adenosine-specific RNA methylase IME4